MKHHACSGAGLAGLAVITAACSGPAPKPMPASESRTAPPANPLKEAYFGEQHLHTAYSLDGYIGGARLTPSDAYRFAKGEEVEVSGAKVRLRAPSDRAAVTEPIWYTPQKP